MFQKILLLLMLFCLSFCAKPEKWVSPRFKALGTTASITLMTGHSQRGDSVFLQVSQEIANLAKLFNRYDPDSDLSKLNQSSEESFVVSPALFTVLQKAKNLCETTGVFDVSLLPLIEAWDYKKAKIPSDSEIQQALELSGCRRLKLLTPPQIWRKAGTRMDLGGIAKGYVIDRAVDTLKALKVRAGIVEIGGDLFAFGREWRVGILNPADQTPLYAVKLKNQAIATSGDYERFFQQDGVVYSHILDPRTGKPVRVSAHSVSVIGPEAVLADGLATACFILGPEKSFELLKKYYPDYGAVFILPGGEALTSPDFPYALEKLIP